MIAQKDDKSGALMYDLRIDPDEFTGLSTAELAKRWAARGPDALYFPVKTLGYNRCPAVAPLEVLEAGDGYEKLQLPKLTIKNNLAKLQAATGFGDKLLEALETMWPKRQAGLVTDPQKVDGQLDDAFVKDEDKTKMSAVRAADANELSKMDVNFKDERLKLLLPLYKARNYPKSLSDAELNDWQAFRRQKLIAGGQAEKFFSRLEELNKTPSLNGEQKYLLEELNLYGQSITPEE